MGHLTQVEMYIAAIERHARLTEQQQQDLAVELSARISAGEDLLEAAAAKQLLEANLRIVVSIAKRYEGRDLSPTDLIGEGNKGLFQAVQAFDPLRGETFATFAEQRIEEAITDALGDPPTSGAREPRRPRPDAGSGALALPLENDREAS